MVKVTVYGSGNSRCKQMRIRVHNAMFMLGLRDFEIEIEGDERKFPSEITETPALMIHDKVVCVGRLPEIAELQRLIAPYTILSTHTHVA